MRVSAATEGPAVAALELCFLGPLEVRRAGEVVQLGGRQQRALLGLLALERGAPISVDSIVDSLWPERPPATAAHAVEVYVSKLRKALGGTAIATRAGGYLLALAPEEVDRERFERLLAEGEEALPHDPAFASSRLAEALSLWRGSALSDFTYEPFAQAEIARLEELRLRAKEAWIDAELALGRGHELTGELEALVSQAPLREHGHALRMRALYQAGRQADALAAYREARATLRDEFGLEPGPELKALERAILAEDPALAARQLPPARPREVRKWVTVLVCDLVEYTHRSSGVDPEVLTATLDRYFETVSTAIARHGGTVESFIGGSVVAVFGVPVVHEDDALRAVRAAKDVTIAASELGEELEREKRVGLTVRVAVESGEVIMRATANRDEHVTGDAAIMAVRLQAAAEPGEVVLGEATRGLVAHAARLEPRARVATASGHPRVCAWRLLELLPDAPALPRRFDADLVGRERELAELRDHLASAVEERRPVLVSVIGEPGIGKTRLAREFAASLDGDALVLAARVPSYGEGATLAPLRDIVEQAAGGDSREAVLAALSGDNEAGAVADRIEPLLGLSDESYQREETFWAVRRLLERLARAQPLVLIVDDLHWAWSTFLDLLEHVAATASRSILLVCLARTDPLEDRPRWGEGAPTLMLSSLSPVEGEALVGALADRTFIPEGERARIVTAGAGNPLFLEQLIAFAAEMRGPASIPPTLESLLASRLDQLGPGERAVLEAAAAVGTEFTLPAVIELLPEELASAAPRHVEALTRKGFLAPDSPPAPFTSAARFRHALLRNAAYGSIPKTRRADLHERLADWLAEAPGPLRGEDELVGHHLEQSYHYRVELGRVDERTRNLGAEAARRLATAGMRAHDQHDHASAADLLMRAVGLVGADDPLRLTLLPELGDDLFWLGRYAEARSVVADAIASARRSKDRDAEWHAVLGELSLRAQLATGGVKAEELQRTATEAFAVFEELGDARGIAKAAYWIGDCRLMRGHHEDAALAVESAIANARIAGDDALAERSIGLLTASLLSGPTPVSEAIARAEKHLATASTRMLEQVLLRQLAHLYAQLGRFDTAREYIARSRMLADDFGTEVGRANLAWYFAAAVEQCAGNLEGAEAELRWGYEIFVQLGEQVWRGQAAVSLAGVLVSLGRLDEAETLLGIGDETATSQALESQVLSRLVRAQILAARSKPNEAERLVREALALLDETDEVLARANALLHLARVLSRGGRPDEARSAATEALWLSEKKGNLVLTNEARTVLEATREEIAPTG